MLLDEQVYKNHRAYYFGRRNDYDQNKAKFSDWYFLTNNVLYATFYSGLDGYISECYIEKPLNIFNAKCSTDYNKLETYISKNKISLPLSDLHKLKNNDWTFALDGDENRGSILNIVLGLGYDGFYNNEFVVEPDIYMPGFIKKSLTNNNPSIGIKSLDNINVIRTYKGQKDFMKIQAFVDKNKEESERIKDFLWKHIKSNDIPTDVLKSMLLNCDYITLSKKDVADIIEHFSIEDFIESKDEFFKKIYKESQLYGKSLNTYNGIHLRV